MKTAILVAAIMFSAGCIVGESTTTQGGGTGGGGDGDGMGGGGGSGSGSGSGMATVDGGAALPACTNAIYDPCTSAAQCTSGNCTLFQGAGFQVCTQTCTPGDNTTCPMQNGQPATCNNMGICKPNAANSCMR
ncbi:MAG TPA: hypothetical protein VIV40_36110 [Kofleriaceae bacterium]